MPSASASPSVARRSQIEKFKEKQGRKPTVKEIALITRKTRPAALKEIATPEVVAFQRSQLSPEEWGQLEGLRSQAEAQTVPIERGQERKALRASVSHLFERSSVLREHEILAEALNQSLGSLDLGRLKQVASNGEGGLVRLTDSLENQLLSECWTRQGLRLEQQAVKYVDDTRNTCPALNSRFVPAAHLSKEQKEKKKVVVAVASRKEIVLDLRRSDSFDVARPRQIEVTLGDKILIRANDRQLGLTNGQVLSISGITPDGALKTKQGVCVPADFRQWCHGYVVTSHKAQGWTADHVVIAADRFSSKGAYVACSRGRKSCIVHTPDKARLIERLPEGNRRAALDALSEIRPKNASIVNRVRAWKQLSMDIAQHIAARPNQESADGTPIANAQKGLSQRF